jgi:apolipoprotein N-acyltransferase
MEVAQSRIETWFARRTPWQRRGIALAAGAMATLGHAPFQIAPLYIAAIVVLVWLLDAASAQKRRILAAASMGWWFALGHLTTGFYWVSSAFLVDSHEWGPLWGVPATLALSGGLGLYWAAGCALAMAFWTRDMRRIAVFAASLFITEWLRGNAFTGFPWLLPGYIWTPGEPISQLASLFGIYGLTLVTLLVSAVPATLADGRLSGAMRFAPTLAAALALGMSWGWGAERIARAPVDPLGAQPVVRVADSGLSQAQKWCELPTMAERRQCWPRQEWRVLQRYLDASGPAEQSHADILVWPEGAIPTLNFFVLDNQDFLNALGRGLGDRALVMGFTRCAPNPIACEGVLQGRVDPESVQLFNSAAVIDGVSGAPRIGQVYDKHHLVPFGEYIPFWSLVRGLRIAPLQQIGAGFVPGPPPTRLILPGAPPAVVLICYEAIFPGLTPHDERPGWIINISNDAWFGDPALFTGPWQHFEIARYRAIEEGLPMARAASGGISGIIDSFGRVVRSTARRGGFAEAQLPPALPSTLFVNAGNFVLLTMLCLTAALRLLPPGRVVQDRKP